jgi:hypothetical protein
VFEALFLKKHDGIRSPADITVHAHKSSIVLRRLDHVVAPPRLDDLSKVPTRIIISQEGLSTLCRT